MIIFTCITNGYDEIPDDHYYDPDVQYVCYTDGSITHKGPWEFREIPLEHHCPLRRALFPKIRIDECFPLGSEVVWIDGCYVMTKKWVEFSKNMFPRTHMLHPKRFTYYEEIVEGYLSAFNSKEDVIKITETAKDMGYNFKKYSSPVLACMWQTVTDTQFHKFWWNFSQISTRCDMIGFDITKQLFDLEWNTVDDWFSTGIDFTGVGGSGRKGRRKMHPQNGDLDQWKRKDEILSELFKITRLHPKFYCKYWERQDKFQEWVEAHV